MEDGDGKLPASGNLRLSQVLPAFEEFKKSKVIFTPTPAIPSMMKKKEEVVVERVMENCAFKTVMACVLGIHHFGLQLIKPTA